MDENIFFTQDGKDILNILKAVDDLDLVDHLKISSIFDNNIHIHQIKKHPCVVQDYHTSVSFTTAFNRALLILNPQPWDSSNLIKYM